MLAEEAVAVMELGAVVAITTQAPCHKKEACLRLVWWRDASHKTELLVGVGGGRCGMRFALYSVQLCAVRC